MALRVCRQPRVSFALSLQVDVEMGRAAQVRIPPIALRIVLPNAIRIALAVPLVNLNDARREALGKIRSRAKRAAPALKPTVVQVV